ncbi:MAG: hypothetical protein A2X59_02400 [Nitrospirae bacterium GWC2_42_7]|nr:MAG: hypothetical protein A2X59_02400 [Nitrospirae bacterium GWC2_42_7]
MKRTHIRSGRWTEEDLDRIIRESSKIKTIGRRIDFLSKQFLGLRYKGSTLIGDMNTKEILVIDLEGVDCFTYLDYVEAMRMSVSYSEFTKNLTRVRYRNGKVAFRYRNHFFTDWIYNNSDMVGDATYKVGGRTTKQIKKMLNRKKDGTFFIPGIKTIKREIRFIPSADINALVIRKLRTGDYVGIYSDMQGLDVSHVGIIIKNKGNIYLRHASSLKENKKVVDQDLMKYISKRPGIVVLRPKG